jgi:hypothetical protein
MYACFIFTNKTRLHAAVMLVNERMTAQDLTLGIVSLR